MEKVGIILLNSLKDANYNKRLMEAKIFVDYESMVGKKISTVSKPLFIRNNMLFIGAENHIWIHQLYLLKPEIIDNINSGLTRPLVKDIRFRICTLEKTEKPKPVLKAKQMPQIKISEKNKRVIYNTCENINDKDLRKIFARLMIKDLKYKLKKGEKHCLST